MQLEPKTRPGHDIERCSILVVDDENGPRQALRILLKEEHDVFLAGSVDEARSALQTEPLDLVITDLRMPNESGIALLQWIKEHHPGVEVVILTGYGQLETAVKAVEYGAFAYIEKPFDNAAMFDTIQQALAKRRRELERRQLERLALEANRFETLGRFVSGMLHDLSTPLSVIGSYIELSRIDNEPGSLERRLSVMQAQTKHCADIVRSAMNFLRDGGSRLADLNLNDVVESCLCVSGPIISRQPVEVTRDLADELPWCNGEFVLIRQAMLNLINNAVQAMEKQREPREIHIRTWLENDRVCVSVKDSGPGIPPEMHSRVFETFFTTKGSAGNGLGLAVVRHIMKRHGGEVILGDPAESPDEPAHRGAEFVLKFPISRPSG